MSKRRGFTLTEVLVVILLTTLVLAMVGGTLVFLTQSSGTLIHKGEELTLTQSIEDYLRGLLKTGKVTIAEISEKVKLDQNKNLCFNDEIAFEDTGLDSFDIVREPAEGNKYFVKCYMKYKNGSEYSFILGVYQ